MQKTVILCYGDSNTHGMTPIVDLLNPVRGRYDHDIRWPKIVQKILGEKVDIIEEGLPGRTTCVDDLLGGSVKNGLTYLTPCLNSHFPIDIIILMLGTNDLKAHFSRTAKEISTGIETLLDTIVAAEIGRNKRQPDILLVAPPPILEHDAMFAGGRAKSQQLAALYQDIAQHRRLNFLDAGKVITVSSIDGIHFDRESHLRLGEVMSDYIQKIIG